MERVNVNRGQRSRVHTAVMSGWEEKVKSWREEDNSALIKPSWLLT